MKRTLQIAFALLIAILIGFAYGRAYERQHQNVFKPSRVYHQDAPANSNPQFLSAYNRLLKTDVISATTSLGKISAFRETFDAIYEHGEVLDFEVTALNTNPIVRAMGLLCLKYRSPSRAYHVAILCDRDRTVVEVSGAMMPYRFVAVMEILGSCDFIGTKEASEKIDRKRKEGEHAPPAGRREARRP